MCSAEQPVGTDETAVDGPLGAAPFARAINEKIHELEEGWVGGEYDFVCECDDDACTRVARISAADYDQGLFAMLSGHQQATDLVVGRGEHDVVARQGRDPACLPSNRPSERARRRGRLP